MEFGEPSNQLNQRLSDSLYTVALGVEYQGSGFNGWQIQPDRHNLQAKLEDALSAVANQPIKTICAGRTDAGVHATGQVVHFQTNVVRTINAWIRGANAFLPSSMAVQWAKIVPNDFHARFSALSRSYDYLLYTNSARSALWANRASWHHHTLNIDVLQEAAALLVGTHDFSSFRAQECQASTPIRHMHALSVELCSGATNSTTQFIRFHFRANAFLQHMVRNLVGSLVYVGNGKRSVTWLADVLAAKNRHLAAPTYAPDGLYLVGVEYPHQFDLPAIGRRPLF